MRPELSGSVRPRAMLGRQLAVLQAPLIDGLSRGPPTLLDDRRLPAGRVYRAPEMIADPHFAAREAIVEVATERFGKLRMQNAFPRLSETPSGIRSPAPSTVGQHNAEVYGALLGLDAARLDELAATGAI